MLDAALSRLILATQGTPFGGAGAYAGIPVEQQEAATPLDKAAVEEADAERFFTFFPQAKGDLRGRRVLDFGSGYGGRTVAYAKYGPLFVAGTEPFSNLIEAGRELARRRGATNVQFDLCSQERIPYENASFDRILTFDVLEHVDNPRVSLSELARVLRPGGKIYAVFPPYRGMFSHHLDYVTRLPALHLLFSPERLTRIAGRLVTGPMRGVLDTPPETRKGYRGNVVLAQLNGMGVNDFRDNVRAAGLSVVSLRQNSVGHVIGAKLGVPRFWNAVFAPTLVLPQAIAEVFTFNVAAILTKP